MYLRTKSFEKKLELKDNSKSKNLSIRMIP
jgi:hypothetical protein